MEKPKERIKFPIYIMMDKIKHDTPQLKLKFPF